MDKSIERNRTKSWKGEGWWIYPTVVAFVAVSVLGSPILVGIAALLSSGVVYMLREKLAVVGFLLVALWIIAAGNFLLAFAPV